MNGVTYSLHHDTLSCIGSRHHRRNTFGVCKGKWKDLFRAEQEEWPCETPAIILNFFTTMEKRVLKLYKHDVFIHASSMIACPSFAIFLPNFTYDRERYYIVKTLASLALIFSLTNSHLKHWLRSRDAHQNCWYLLCNSFAAHCLKHIFNTHGSLVLRLQNSF